MSSISGIKQRVEQIGKNAASTAQQLNQLATNLERSVADINNAISGTASGEDKDMVTYFQQASKAVKDAAIALQAASQSAKNWAANA